MNLKSLASFMSILCMGLLTGHSLAMVDLIGPAVAQLPPDAFVEVNTITEPTFAKIFPFFFLVLLASLGTWWILSLKKWKSREFLHLNLALLCFADMLYVVYRAQVPLNNIMTSWKTHHSLPANWINLRQEWMGMMNFHLALSAGAFILLLLAHFHRNKQATV